jgi:hypothetical protein
MYLSLLERNACGPPSDEKLQSLAAVLGEPHAENFFAKAGRVTPQVAKTILRHPTPWTEVISAAKDLDADHLAGLKSFAVLLHQGAGKSYLMEFLKKFMSDLSVADEKSQRKQPSKGKAGLQRGTKDRATTTKARVSSVRRVKGASHAPRLLPGQAGRP